MGPDVSKQLHRKHPGKKLQDVALLVIARIRWTQRLLSASYNNDDMLCTKLLNIVSVVKACRFAVQKPFRILDGIQTDIMASISTINAEQQTTTTISPHEPEATALLTDRKRRDRIHCQQNHRGGKRCYICKRQGCHNPKKRAESLRNNKGFRTLLTSIAEDGPGTDQDDPGTDLAPSCLKDSAALLSNYGHQTADDPQTHGDSADCPGHFGEKYHTYLTTRIAMHAISRSILEPTKADSNQFAGILIGPGCSVASASRQSQLEAYCKFAGRDARIDSGKRASTRFGKGSSESLGFEKYKFPVGHMWMEVDVHARPKTDISILLFLRDLYQLVLHFNRVTKTFYHSKSGPVPTTPGRKVTRSNAGRTSRTASSQRLSFVVSTSASVIKSRISSTTSTRLRTSSN